MRVSIVAIANGEKSLNALLAATQMLNEVCLRTNPDIPHPFAAGLRYQREPQHDLYVPNRVESEERWQTIPILLSPTSSDIIGCDCDDIAPYMAAWCRVREGDDGARAIVQKVAPGQWHVVVRRGDGRIEDPCIKLGMRGR